MALLLPEHGLEGLANCVAVVRSRKYVCYSHVNQNCASHFNMTCCHIISDQVKPTILLNAATLIKLHITGWSDFYSCIHIWEGSKQIFIQILGPIKTSFAKGGDTCKLQYAETANGVVFCPPLPTILQCEGIVVLKQHLLSPWSPTASKWRVSRVHWLRQR